VARAFTSTDLMTRASMAVPSDSSYAFWYRMVTGTATAHNLFTLNATLINLFPGSTSSDWGFIRDYATTDGNWSVSYANLGSPTLTDWHHFCVVHADGSTPTMYFDGVAMTVTVNASPSGAVDTATRTLVVGNRGAGDRPAEGALAYVSYYARALSLSEVEEAMDEGVTTSPVAYWTPGVASPETDQSGNGFDLTVVGTTVVDDPDLGPPAPGPALIVNASPLRW
jgi:hypothetical protein